MMNMYQREARRQAQLRWCTLPTCFTRTVEPLPLIPGRLQRFRSLYLCKVCNKTMKNRTSVWPHMDTKLHEKNMIMERLAK
jgi:hypothetical protein